MLRNFRRSDSRDKQRYLRYDDVFLGGKKSHNLPSDNQDFRRNDSQSFRESNIRNSNRNYAEVEDDDDYVIDEGLNDNDQYDNRSSKYFSGRNSIIDERMVKYQKRQLPPLQRYSPNSYKNPYEEFNQSYWEDDYSNQRNRSNFTSLRALWKKFILTFVFIISLILVAWIGYNWNSGHQPAKMTANGIPLIEPEQNQFRVLPDNPGGEQISYRDKTVYEKVNNMPINVQEKLLPPQEDVGQYSQLEEYSIVDDKTYYIKISAGKTKAILQNELNLLKKKYPSLIDGNNCSIKRVSNSNGETKYAILIGPFDSQNVAIDTAKSIGGQCYVISVKD